MKKIEKLNLTRLTSLEIGQLIKSTCEGFAKMEGIIIKDEILANYVKALETKSAEYDKAQMQILKSDETAKIVEADRQRDVAISAMQRILNVYELTENPAELEAFTSLTNLFKNYKGIQSWNLEEETNGIENLLGDLNTAKYSQHLTTLQMQSFVGRITTANNNFKAIFSGRTQEKANKEVFDIKLLRDEMKKVYLDLMNYVLSLSKALDTEQYNRSLSLINATRKYYSDLVARRNPKKTTAQTETTETTAVN